MYFCREQGLAWISVMVSHECCENLCCCVSFIHAVLFVIIVQLERQVLFKLFVASVSFHSMLVWC